MNANRHFGRKNRSIAQAGFSLVEVVIATGLCTYALIVIAGLLPVGIGTIRTATQETVETEIFSQLWSEFNSTPFDNLSGASPQTTLLNTSASNPFWFDSSSQQISTSSGAVYYVRCSLVNSNASPTLNATVPPVDGGSTISGGAITGPGLNFAKIQIGYHVDPQATTATDPRVTTRTFLLVKRDGY